MAQPHATLTLDKRKDCSQCGVVKVDRKGRIQDFIEKPAPGGIRSPWVNSGIMILDKRCSRRYRQTGSVILAGMSFLSGSMAVWLCMVGECPRAPI